MYTLFSSGVLQNFSVVFVSIITNDQRRQVVLKQERTLLLTPVRLCHGNFSVRKLCWERVWALKRWLSYNCTEWFTVSFQPHLWLSHRRQNQINPPRHRVLCYLFFSACLLAAPVLTRLRSVLRHLRQIWTQSSGLGFKDYGGKKYLPPFFLKVSILGKYMVPKRRNLRFDP